jgi:hypothetical protein
MRIYLIPYNTESTSQAREEPAPDRRNQTEAGRLRRAAWRANRAGYTSLAILLNNSAWIAAHGQDWHSYAKAELQRREKEEEEGEGEVS